MAAWLLVILILAAVSPSFRKLVGNLVGGTVAIIAALALLGLVIEHSAVFLLWVAFIVFALASLAFMYFSLYRVADTGTLAWDPAGVRRPSPWGPIYIWSNAIVGVAIATMAVPAIHPTILPAIHWGFLMIWGIEFFVGAMLMHTTVQERRTFGSAMDDVVKAYADGHLAKDAAEREFRRAYPYFVGDLLGTDLYQKAERYVADLDARLPDIRAYFAHPNSLAVG